MTATSAATQITALVVGFFALLALLAVARAIFRPSAPTPRRFRVGVFVERDHEQGAERPGPDVESRP